MDLTAERRCCVPPPLPPVPAAGFGLSNYSTFQDPINLPRSHLYSLNDNECSARCAARAAEAGNQTSEAAPSPTAAARAEAPAPQQRRRQQQQPGRRLAAVTAPAAQARGRQLAQLQGHGSAAAGGSTVAEHQQRASSRRQLLEAVHNDYMASLLKAPADVENSYATRRQLSHGGCASWVAVPVLRPPMAYPRPSAHRLARCCPESSVAWVGSLPPAVSGRVGWPRWSQCEEGALQKPLPTTARPPHPTPPSHAMPSADELPGLGETDFQVALAELKACSMSALHLQPNADEFTTILSGEPPPPPALSCYEQNTLPSPAHHVHDSSCAPLAAPCSKLC